MKICWICQSISQTGEHRIKKSDLVERFGKGPYGGPDAPVHIKEGRIRDVQGPASKLVKYEKNLCANCNNTFTQPFDKAYEEFIAWIAKNRVEVISRRVIDLEVVYGSDWETKQRNLFKYFAKCLGCRLDETDRTVPKDVVELLKKDSFMTALYVTFQVNENARTEKGIGTFSLFADKKKSTGEETGFWCGHFYSWLTMKYWYNHFPLEPVGAAWIANSKFLYLGWSDVDLTKAKA